MNNVDIILAIPLVLGLVVGFFRGLVKEAIRLSIIVLGLVLSYLLGKNIASFLLIHFHWAKWICETVSYTLIFICVALILTSIGKLVVKFLNAVHLDFLNKLLGAGFGLIKWGLILTILILGFNFINKQFSLINPAILENSVLYNFFLHMGENIIAWIETVFIN